MGYDLIVAVVVVMALVAVHTGIRTVRAVRRFRRKAQALLLGARRGESMLTDAGWWANQRERRRMWRAVAIADRAVAAARGAGVPTGDLRSVVRQLRTAATTLDAGLAGPRSSTELHRQARTLAAAADDVARAAADAVAADAAPVIARVVDAARLELAALR